MSGARVLALVAALSLLAAPLSAESPAGADGTPHIDVMVDAREILVTTTIWLATDGGFYDRARSRDYADAIDAWFGEHVEHPAVKLAEELTQRGFSYDAPVGWILHYGPPPELVPQVALDPYHVERAGSERLLRQYAAALRDFAVDADLAGFMEATSAFNAALVRRAEEVVAHRPYAADLEAWFGESHASYTLVVTPTLGPVNFAARVQGEGGLDVFQLSSPLPYESRAELQDELSELIAHELGHTFVNPAVDEAWAAFEPSAALFEPIREEMSRQAYPDWRIAAKEHVVRAAVCRQVRAWAGEEAARSCVADDVSRGFRYLPPLYEALGDYEADRRRFPTLRTFLPRLGEVLVGVDGTEAEARAVEAARAAARSLNQASDALRDTSVVVFPTRFDDEELATQTADYVRDMAKRFYGGRAISDLEALELDPSSSALVLYGTPATNLLLGRHLETMPLSADADGVTIGALRFDEPDLRLIAVVPNPSGSGPPWRVYTGTSPAVIPGINAVFHGPTGWVVEGGTSQLTATGFLPSGGAASKETPHGVPDATLLEDLSHLLPPLPSEPIAWPASTPKRYTPEGFEQLLREAVETCEAPVEILAIDCSEPPCMATLRPLDGGWHDLLINKCPAWRGPYGNSVTSSQRSVECGEGRSERGVILAPYWDAPREADPENWSRRLDLRWGALWKGWSCGPAR